MKKVLASLLTFISMIIITGVSLVSCHNSAVNTGLPPAQDEWTILFDGSNTDAWRGFKKDNLPDGWGMSNGFLYTSGEGGDLGGDVITKDIFEDFELSLEWKISKGGNSGIFFNVIEGDNPTIYASGPEYQLIDDLGFAYPLGDWQKTAANYDMHIADSTIKKINPAGEWNQSTIKVLDGHVTHWLNGDKVVEYDLWSDDWKARVAKSKWKDYPNYGLAIRGHLGLQDHGDSIWFRDIRVRDLTDKGVSLFNGKDLEGWIIHGTEKWYVDNGELICESGDDKAYGYLRTEKPYQDFLLRLKFLQESDGNSGVFFRSSIDGTTISGWQVEVAPPGNNTGGIYESYGRGWLWEIPEEKENILKMGEWNDLTIRVEGDRVITWLNSQMMTDLRDEKIGQASGSVALQIHDGGGIRVRWKDIYIRELNKSNDELQ
ncbi:MAG TPA: DUF1080 domain-containing protein [Bacteroidales bacterium]|nr:DUF1080 domain-containing protein [Bacteroidales bacterium]